MGMGMCIQTLLLFIIHTFTYTIALNLIHKSPKFEETESKDLVFVHVPYNFGHTVEKIALFPPSWPSSLFALYIMSLGGFGDTGRQASPAEVEYMRKPGGAAWGKVNPDLQVESKITGCNLAFTPPKYWPDDIAKHYIGNKTTFGILRDPTERLVAMFRGNIPAYGAMLDEYYENCNVDGAIRSMLISQFADGDTFGKGCTRIQQADYFDGPYGIKIAIDNRRFPQSMNEQFIEHGYDWQIRDEDVMHINGCDHIGTWNVSHSTKLLVQQAYPRDFELLCKLFGYCNPFENTCISGVEGMCPDYARHEPHAVLPVLGDDDFW